MRRITVAAVGVALAFGVLLVGPPAGATGPTTSYVPVIPADLINYPSVPSSGQFNVINEGDGSGGVATVTGPAPVPGSLRLTVAGTGSHWSVLNYDHDGTLLKDVTSLGYTTDTNDSSNIFDPGLQLVIDPGNTTGLDAGVTYSTVNFEPYLQPPSDPVRADTWQTWNVLSGVVWGTHLTGAPVGSPITWSSFLADYPNAKIIGGVGVNAGSGWSPMVGTVGTLTFGTAAATTSYIFEPVAYLQITTTSLPSGAPNQPYSAALSAIGGNPPYKWSIASGSLPTGLHLNKSTGVISGTPKKNDGGPSPIVVKVVDTKVKTKHHPPTQNSAYQALSIGIS